MYEAFLTVQFVLLVLLALSCIIANGLICYVIWTKMVNDGAFKYYLFSMSIADIMVGILIIPIFVYLGLASNAWKLETLRLYWYIDMFFAECSMLHISLISFDRMIAITHPLFHRIYPRTWRNALNLILIPWLLALLITLATIAADSPIWTKYTASLVVGTGVPFLFSTSCYILVFIKIRKRNRQFSRQFPNANVINEMRFLKIVFCVLALFLVCWFPYAICNVMTLSSTKMYPLFGYMYGVSRFLHYLDSICSPIAYALFNIKYRAAVKDVFKRCICRKLTRARYSSVERYGLNPTAV